MCFSASASFAASGFLALSSLYSIHKTIDAEERGFLPIALVPLFFSLQQLLEGIIWLSFSTPSYHFLIRIASYIYLFFALSFWPFWVPFSLAVFDVPRRILFLLFTLGGFIFAIIAYIYLLLHPHIYDLKVMQHSICYLIDCKTTLGPGLIIYLLLTVLPLLCASWNRIKVLGVLLLLSASGAYGLYQNTFVSVWCFFAAILSLYIAYLSYLLEVHTEK